MKEQALRVVALVLLAAASLASVLVQDFVNFVNEVIHSVEHCNRL